LSSTNIADTIKQLLLILL